MTNPAELQVNQAEVTALKQFKEDQQMDHFMQKYFNMDFPERRIDDYREAYVEDKIFMEKMKESLQLKDGHYEIGLPNGWT